MGVSGEVRDQLAVKFEGLLPHLDERQRRLLIGAEVRNVGHGGIRAVARAAEVSEATAHKAWPNWKPARTLWAGTQVWRWQDESRGS